MSQEEEKEMILEVTSPGNPEKVLSLILRADISSIGGIIVGIAMCREGLDAMESTLENSGITPNGDLRDWNLVRAVQSVSDSVEELIDATAFGMATVTQDDGPEA